MKVIATGRPLDSRSHGVCNDLLRMCARFCCFVSATGLHLPLPTNSFGAVSLDVYFLPRGPSGLDGLLDFSLIVLARTPAARIGRSGDDSIGSRKASIRLVLGKIRVGVSEPRQIRRQPQLLYHRAKYVDRKGIVPIRKCRGCWGWSLRQSEPDWWRLENNP